MIDFLGPLVDVDEDDANDNMDATGAPGMALPNKGFSRSVKFDFVDGGACGFEAGTEAVLISADLAVMFPMTFRSSNEDDKGCLLLCVSLAS
jgi:hypothetical protein